jgi:hypothetical protein
VTLSLYLKEPSFSGSNLHTMKKHLLAVAFLIAGLTVSHAQGSITFANTIASRIVIVCPPDSLPVPAGAAIVYGVFWGPSGTFADQLQLNSGPLGTAHPTSAGIISAVSPYIIVGAPELSIVSMQIRAWSASFGRDWQAARNTPGAIYAESDVRQVRLLATAGPGAIIWQGATGTAPDRFTPFLYCVPEPTAIGLLAFGLGSLLLFRRRRSP